MISIKDHTGSIISQTKDFSINGLCTENRHLLQWTPNDSTITNLRQSRLCLDLHRITASDNCTTAMESLAHLLTIHTSCVVL